MMTTATGTLADRFERAIFIQVRDEIVSRPEGAIQSAAAFTQWLEQYRVSREELGAAWLDGEDRHGSAFRTHVDGWVTLYIYGPDSTLIKDNGGNCYIVPDEAEQDMPTVIGGDAIIDDGQDEEDEEES